MQIKSINKEYKFVFLQAVKDGVSTLRFGCDGEILEKKMGLYISDFYSEIRKNISERSFMKGVSFQYEPLSVKFYEIGLCEFEAFVKISETDHFRIKGSLDLTDNQIREIINRINSAIS